MNQPDEFQQMWQREASRKEDYSMILELIAERRANFRELERAKNYTEYIVVLSLTPLLLYGAWFTGLSAVRGGFLLMAASLLMLALGMWWAHRRTTESTDRSVREQLVGLIDEYDRRVRFLRRAMVLFSVPFMAGLMLAIAGMRRPVSGGIAFGIGAVVVAAFFWGQWRTFRRERAAVLEKRARAEALLTSLEGGAV